MIRPLWTHGPLGLLRVTGPDRVSLLHRLCTQDMQPLAAANAHTWALFLNGKGRVLDWVQATSDADSVILHTTAHKAASLALWLDGYTIMDDVQYAVVNETAQAFTLAVDSPEAVRALTPLMASLDLPQAPKPGQQAPSSTPQLWAVPPHAALGAGVVLVAADAATATRVHTALQGAWGPPLDERARRELHLRAGLPRPEAAFAMPAAPFELRLGGESIHWHKGCYIGQEIISRLEAYDKVQRLTMGIAGPQGAKALADAPGDLKVYVQGALVGKVTDWVPALDGLGFVGLALVKREAAQPAISAVSVQTGPDAATAVPAALHACPLWALAEAGKI